MFYVDSDNVYTINELKDIDGEIVDTAVITVSVLDENGVELYSGGFDNLGEGDYRIVIPNSTEFVSGSYYTLKMIINSYDEVYKHVECIVGRAGYSTVR